MQEYYKFNREERNLCAHLFRLLHETNHSGKSPLEKFLEKCQKDIDFSEKIDTAGIFCEVAIIRDYYFKNRNSGVSEFMDGLTNLIIEQVNINGECRLYSELPELLKNTDQTNPKQIKHKAQEYGLPLNKEESTVYGTIQGMFNAKPDLLITYGNTIFTVEAKFTQSFDMEQLNRTELISKVWAKLLYKELGFEQKPMCQVITLGAKKFKPDICWSDIQKITEETYNNTDRSRKAIIDSVNLLKTMNLE